MKCKDCSFWDKLYVNNTGYCRKYRIYTKEDMEFDECMICEHEWIDLNDLEEECIICDRTRMKPEYYKIFPKD